MSLISDLFNGEIRPDEKFIKRNSRYYNLNRELSDKIIKFTEKLEKQEKDEFEEIHSAIFEISFISEEERYIEGFCTGVKLMQEVMNYKSENFK